MYCYDRVCLENFPDSASCYWESPFSRYIISDEGVRIFYNESDVIGFEQVFFPDWVGVSNLLYRDFKGLSWAVKGFDLEPFEVLELKHVFKPCTMGVGDLSIKVYEMFWRDLSGDPVSDFQSSRDSGVLAVLDPWVNGSFGNCTNILISELSGVDRVDHPFFMNVTGLTVDDPREVLVYNQSCYGSGGVSYPYKVVDSYVAGAGVGNDRIGLTILANLTASSTNWYSVYHNFSGNVESDPTLTLWAFYEYETNAKLIDSSGNSRTLTACGGTPVWTSSGFDGSGAFDFDGDCHDMGAFPSGTQITVSAWVYDQDSSGLAYVVGSHPTNDNLWYLGMNPANRGGFCYEQSGLEKCAWGSGTYTANSWNHGSGRVNASAGSYWANGTLLTANSDAGNWGGNACSRIGMNCDSEFSVDGYIDEVMIFTSALSNEALAGLGADTKPNYTILGVTTSTSTSTTSTSISTTSLYPTTSLSVSTSIFNPNLQIQSIDIKDDIVNDTGEIMLPVRASINGFLGILPQFIRLILYSIPLFIILFTFGFAHKTVRKVFGGVLK